MFVELVTASPPPILAPFPERSKSSNHKSPLHVLPPTVLSSFCSCFNKSVLPRHHKLYVLENRLVNMPKKKKSQTKKKKSQTKKKTSQSTLRSKKFGRRVLKASRRQTGRSNTKRVRAHKAMQPGKRRSARGRIYYEHRRNRSDLRGRRV